jgi:hypothetical protein
MQAWQKLCVHLEQMTLELLDNFDRTLTPRWLRRRCEVDVDATRAKGAATCNKGVRCEGTRIT